MKSFLIVLVVSLMGGAMTAKAELPAATAASVGMDQAALDRLRAEMAALVTDGRRAGIVYGVAYKGRIVALEALGERNRELKLPMERDTAFRIYSQSRALTASATLALVEEGKLSLDDTVAKYIPEIANMKVITRVDGDKVLTENQKAPMTVRHLFTYTAGLGYAFHWPKSLGMDQLDILNIEKPIADSIRKLATYPLLMHPGAKWHYGFSGDVLGRVAEVAAGQPFDVVLRTRLLDKLGLKKTWFWVSEDDAKNHRLADVYGTGPDGKALVNQTATVIPLSTYTKPGPLFSAGGGLVSTTADYLTFLQMLLNDGQLSGVRVLQPETVKAMISRQTTPEQGLVYWYEKQAANAPYRGYAWGLSIGVRPDDAGPNDTNTRAGEVGWAGLAGTYYFINPRHNLAAVAMSQYQGPDGAVLMETLRRGVYSALKE